VPSREPSWWYSAQTSLAARSLAPAAWIFATFARRRLLRAPLYRSTLPVVCIGNFTAGGTGKTPLALSLAAALRQRGHAPAFLTRGYGADVSVPTLADPARHTARDVGDEALLLARAGAVMVSADRVAGARAIEDLQPAADVILMDDGLQNPGLAKDLTIAVVDGARLFGNGRVIPAGPLRAPLGVQVQRTDLVVVNGTPQERDAVARRLASEGYTGPVAVARAEPAEELSWLAGRSVLAYAGIGNPDRFYRLIERLGGRLAATRTFADHHAYTAADCAALLAAADELGAELVTTEKDLVRLRDESPDHARLRRQSRTLPITLRFDDDADEAIVTRIAALIEARRPHRAPP
jgi:tetraacyldisaccharide 4'-kinase